VVLHHLRHAFGNPGAERAPSSCKVWARRVGPQLVRWRDGLSAHLLAAASSGAQAVGIACGGADFINVRETNGASSADQVAGVVPAR